MLCTALLGLRVFSRVGGIGTSGLRAHACSLALSRQEETWPFLSPIIPTFVLPILLFYESASNPLKVPYIRRSSVGLVFLLQGRESKTGREKESERMCLSWSVPVGGQRLMVY